MDFGSLLGIVVGFVVIIMTIGHGFAAFVSPHAAIVVFGGCLAAVLIKFNLKSVLSAFKVAAKAFYVKSDRPVEIIKQVVSLADMARKGGLLSLEDVEIKNEFLGRGVRYLVDGIEPEMVRRTMHRELAETMGRHEMSQKIFKAIGDAAPAMGMVGTLIGLVQMFGNMSDPSSIGPAMAVALLATFYGAVLANILAMPIAEKLALRTKEEMLTKNLVIDALTGIQNGQNPRVIEQLLMAYLPPALRPQEEK